MRMIAREDFVYAGKALKAGEEFLARTPDDATILNAIGKARAASEPQASQSLLAPDSAGPPRVDAPQRKRNYKRRDLRADDSEPQS